MDGVVVVPGEVITREEGHIKGHGTQSRAIYDSAEVAVDQGQLNFIAHTPAGAGQPLIACTAGQISRVNRLVSVVAPHHRYSGEVGDIVVGRVCEVGAKRWKVDIGSTRHAVLQLSSVHLPGGEQRMRTYEDQLQMRTFFEEGDLVSAEVQSINGDGSVSLHTRSLKYGKLTNGLCVTVPQSLVRKQKQHAVTLSMGVDVILGNNGMIWITRTMPAEWFMTDEDDTAESIELRQRLHTQTEVNPADRRRIVAVRNIIWDLHASSLPISAAEIERRYRGGADSSEAP
jgi:exosome complex component RRP4